MKAMQFTRFGALDVLELIDAPTPKATDGNALVQISAAALSMAAPRGRVVEIASTRKRRVKFDLTDFYHNETRLIGADSRKRDAIGCARRLASLTDGFERGRYTAPIVNARYPLARSKEAYAAAKRGSQGRIVLMP